MSYRLVLRSASRNRGVLRGVGVSIRAVLTVFTNGAVSLAGRSILDVEDVATGAVVARWDAPPDAETSAVWLPELQAELDSVGLETFCAKYGLSRTAP